MSFSAAREVKEQVRDAIDIVDLVGSYLELRSEGRNFTALCPWHNDSRPSLKVNRERQSWKCWVCDIGGDVFSFVMKFENVDFREALELLAERAGIPLEAPRRNFVEGTAADKTLLYRALAWAESQYHECLLRAPEAAKARKYLADRGIHEDSSRAFRLGFAPAGWQWLVDRARSTEFSIEVLEAVDLVGRSARGARPYDRFRDRLLFPIRDAQSRPIAFGGRMLPGSTEENVAKYINTSETRVFSKREQLYGLDRARDQLRGTDHAVVVEGYTDVVMAHQHGLTNVVAVLGTALGESHLQILRRYVSRVTLVLDGDEAGQRRANAILELFVGSPLELRISTLPAELDPCEFLRLSGAEQFNSFVTAAPDALTHKIQQCTRGLNIAEDVHGSAHALEEILATLSQVPQRERAGVNPWSMKVPLILSRLAREFRIDERDLRARLGELRRRQRRTKDAPPVPTAKIEPLHAWDRELIQLLIRFPELATRALQAVNSDKLRSPAAKPLVSTMEKLIAADRQPTFETMMLELDDPREKSRLADLADGADRMTEVVPAACLEELLATYRDFAMRRANNEQLADLQSQQYSQQEQMEALTAIVKRQQDRQGISAPTDG